MKHNNLRSSPSEYDVAIRDGPCEDRDVRFFSLFADWTPAALLNLKESAGLHTTINRLAALRSIFFSNRRRERENELGAPSEPTFLGFLCIIPAALLISSDPVANNATTNRDAAIQSVFFSNRRRERENELDAPSGTMFLGVI